MNETNKIANLVFRYAELADSADFQGLGELFAAGAVECFISGVSNGGRCCGTEEVIAWYQSSVGVHPDGSTHTQHMITNLIIEIGADQVTAQARSYFAVLQGLPDFPLQIIAAGRYFDRFKKIREGWQFVEKEIHSNFLGDVSRHYAPLLTAAAENRSSDEFPLIKSRGAV